LIYLDNNATTPVDSRVVATMNDFQKVYFANPHSSHLMGLEVQEHFENAKKSIAKYFGAESMIFTSGATEAINLVLKGLRKEGRKKIITVKTEHSAILNTCKFLETQDYTIQYLEVNEQGHIDLNELHENIDEKTLCVSIMLANNELGTVHPISKIGQIAQEAGAIMFCDATQAVGKMSVNMENIDYLCLSAHKFYGPKGVGALAIKQGNQSFLNPLLHGGNQQSGWRSGTLNVPGIIGMEMALNLCNQQEQQRILNLRNKLEDALLQIEGTWINGDISNRLCNTSNVGFKGVNAEVLMRRLGRICVSTGSACSSVVSQPSHVLKAIGLNDEDALSCIRFSLGRFTTEAEINQTLEKVTSSVKSIRDN
jgi:cysteine desulfurase